MTTYVLSEKAQQKLENSTIEKLVELFEETNVQTVKTLELFEFRGILINEFERRDLSKAQDWIDSGEDSPRRFFMA